MGALLFLAGAALAASTSAQESEPAPVRVMTFNIRHDNPGDGRDAWPVRWPLAVGVARDRAPDVLGLQEALPHQVTEFAAALDGYEFITLGRDPVEGGGGGAGEACPVYWRSERFESNGSGTFWLSESPGEPSFGWDAACRRVATWVRLRERSSGRELLVVNTHFDHRGAEARLGGARLVASRMEELRRRGESPAPAVLLGDLNVQPHHEVYAFLEGRMDDALLVTEAAPLGPTGTYCGFKDAAVTGRRIDYVFVPRGQRVLGYGVVGELADEGRAPSDHRAVWADLAPWTEASPDSISIEGGWRAVQSTRADEVRIDQLPTGELTLERILRVPEAWPSTRIEMRRSPSHRWEAWDAARVDGLRVRVTLDAPAPAVRVTRGS